MYERVDTIYKEATENENKFVSATALSLLVTHLIQKLLILIGQDHIKSAISEKTLQKFYGFAFNAYQLFAQTGMLKDAHFAICNALELLQTAKYFYKSPVEKDIEVLVTEKERLEDELLIERYELLIPDLLNSTARNNGSDEVANSLVTMTDTQLENVSKLMFGPLNLPEERFQNFMSEMRDIRIFQQRCRDNNIEIRVMNGLGTKEAYKSKVSYILINKVTGIQTSPSKNIDHLLAAWGF